MPGVDPVAGTVHVAQPLSPVPAARVLVFVLTPAIAGALRRWGHRGPGRGWRRRSPSAAVLGISHAPELRVVGAVLPRYPEHRSGPSPHSTGWGAFCEASGLSRAGVLCGARPRSSVAGRPRGSTVLGAAGRPWRRPGAGGPRGDPRRGCRPVGSRGGLRRNGRHALPPTARRLPGTGIRRPWAALEAVYLAPTPSGGGAAGSRPVGPRSWNTRSPGRGVEAAGIRALGLPLETAGSPGPGSRFWCCGDRDPWSETRSVRCRLGPSRDGRGWAIPADRLPHWAPWESRHFRLLFRSPGAVAVAAPRLPG